MYCDEPEGVEGEDSSSGKVFFYLSDWYACNVTLVKTSPQKTHSVKWKDFIQI